MKRIYVISTDKEHIAFDGDDPTIKCRSAAGFDSAIVGLLLKYGAEFSIEIVDFDDDPPKEVEI